MKYNLFIYVYGVCKIFVFCIVIGGIFKENIEIMEFFYFFENEFFEFVIEKNIEE